MWQLFVVIIFSSLLLVFIDSQNVDGQDCKPFHQIYESGTQLCENMWSDSFYVVEDANVSYTMSWVDGFDNPNDQITKNLGKSKDIKTYPDDSQKCGLQYYHYNKTQKLPSGELKMCTNYKDNACCHPSTVESWASINTNYGDAYHADRCGPLSEACKAFFIYETCLYECDVNAGIYRMFNDSQVAHDIAIGGTLSGTGPGTGVGAIPKNNRSNSWAMYGMPIRKSFCDSWYEACYNDLFCGAAGGDFFNCAKVKFAIFTHLL